MMAQTWSDICAVFSLTRGWGICANALTIVRTAGTNTLVCDFIVLPCTMPGLGLAQG
jgi:hypothetical protein